MADALVCWKCGESIESLSQPLARLAECEACGAELHVCRMCSFYDPGVSQACREPVAEPVADKERANYCGYFQPRRGAYVPEENAEARAARAQLEALFGGAPAGDGDSETPTAPDDTDEARQQLEALFRSGNDDTGSSDG